jgi:hypothetical protein
MLVKIKHHCIQIGFFLYGMGKDKNKKGDYAQMILQAPKCEHCVAIHWP